MKKIVRLNESDIVRLVKKVISENKKMLNEAPQIDIAKGGQYQGHSVKSLNVVTGGKPFLEVIMNDGSRKTYKVTTALGDVNFKNINMDGGNLVVDFYSGEKGASTQQVIDGNKTYELFEKLKGKPSKATIPSGSSFKPDIQFIAV
jgi:hypothetical protein